MAEKKWLNSLFLEVPFGTEKGSSPTKGDLAQDTGPTADPADTGTPGPAEQPCTVPVYPW